MVYEGGSSTVSMLGVVSFVARNFDFQPGNETVRWAELECFECMHYIVDSERNASCIGKLCVTSVLLLCMA